MIRIETMKIARVASLRCAFAVAIALFAGAFGLSAQQAPVARASAPQAAESGFIGVVIDSIHGGTLVGVTISVLGTDRFSTSDANGRFRIDSVPPGTYRLALSHPLFDTLGISPMSQPVNLTAGHYLVLAFGTPSPRTLRRLLCPTSDTAATPSFIMGRIRDADTGAPADGAQVSMVYSTTLVSIASGVRHEQRVRRATVAADGTYVICGLESDLRGTLQVERAGATTAAVATSLGGKLIALRSLSTGSVAIAVAPNSASPENSSRSAPIGDRAPAPSQATSAQRGLQRGLANVAGFVLDSSGLPLTGAMVAVIATAGSTRTGSKGEFTLGELPSGTQQLAVRSVGFDPALIPVELTVRETRNVTVRLNRAPQALAPVVVRRKTDAGLSLLGFMDRQKTGMGHFITPDDIAKAKPHVASDLMYLVPGYQIQSNSSGLTVIRPPRAAYGEASCINVFVDRALWTSLAPGEFDSAIPARDIVAMEAYSGSTTPIEFVVPGRSCATIVVWTRARAGGR